MGNTIEDTRIIKLRRRKFTPIDILIFIVLGFGAALFGIYVITSEKSSFDFFFIPFNILIIIWLCIRFYQSLITTETYHIGDKSIEIERIRKGAISSSIIEVDKIKSIELKPLGFYSIFTRAFDIILALRICLTMGYYQVPIIDCGSSYYFLAEHYDIKTRRWIITEMKKELNYSP